MSCSVDIRILKCEEPALLQIALGSEVEIDLRPVLAAVRRQVGLEGSEDRGQSLLAVENIANREVGSRLGKREWTQFELGV